MIKESSCSIDRRVEAFFLGLNDFNLRETASVPVSVGV